MSKQDRFNSLVYRDGKRRGSNLRKQYEIWRSEQDPPLPKRCDNPECRFHSEPLLWNGNALELILEHRNGVNTDNRPKNLRFLCPNCDSQLIETRGGANRGRVEKSAGGFAIISKSGNRDYVLPAEAAHFKIEGHNVELSIGPTKGLQLGHQNRGPKKRAVD